MTTKFTADVVHKLLGVREAQQAPTALMGIVMDQQKRSELFKQLFYRHDYHWRLAHVFPEFYYQECNKCGRTKF